MARECVTHHHACDCREEAFKKALEAADVLVSLVRHAPACPAGRKFPGKCKCRVFKAAEEYRAAREKVK